MGSDLLRGSSLVRPLLGTTELIAANAGALIAAFMDTRHMSASVQSFSLCNPHGPAVEDLPLLLRRLADEIESQGIGKDELLDVTFSNDELTDEGWFCWRASVYWSPNEPD